MVTLILLHQPPAANTHLVIDGMKERECRHLTTETNGTDEEELRDIQRRERWPKVLEPAVDF